MNHFRTEWTTLDECDFLDRLGFHRTQECQRLYPQGRRQLLLKYKLSMGLRSEWGQIDPVAVLEHVEKLLGSDAHQ